MGELDLTELEICLPDKIRQILGKFIFATKSTVISAKTKRKNP
jgi:hypothetical protein